jgi:hypothetical protein
LQRWLQKSALGRLAMKTSWQFAQSFTLFFSSVSLK